MNQRTKEELSPNMKRRFLKEWNETIFTLFWKIWVITLFVELLLFCFFKPVPECSRLRYFYLYSEWSGIDFSSHIFELPEKTLSFTLSLGTASYLHTYENATAFFEKADQALYEAKRTGKNKVCSTSQSPTSPAAP